MKGNIIPQVSHTNFTFSGWIWCHIGRRHRMNSLFKKLLSITIHFFLYLSEFVVNMKKCVKKMYKMSLLAAKNSQNQKKGFRTIPCIYIRYCVPKFIVRDCCTHEKMCKKMYKMPLFAAKTSQNQTNVFRTITCIYTLLCAQVYCQSLLHT